MRSFLFLTILTLASACGSTHEDVEASRAPARTATASRAAAAQESGTDAVELSESEWRERLTAEQFHVLREEGTERAFTGAYHDHHAAGVYTCAGCGAELYASESKFDSGTGWPSFSQAIADGQVRTEVDNSLGMSRTEIECARCGGHLGHVFDDGPAPTGKRHCVNSASLNFSAAE